MPPEIDDQQDDEQEIGGYRLPIRLRQAAMAASGTPDPGSGAADVQPVPAERMSFSDRLSAKPPVMADRAPSPASVSQGQPAPAVISNATPKTPPAPPTGSRNPQLVDLLRQQAEVGKPLDRAAIDPQTGKPKYRMGFGARLAGILSNAAAGFGGDRGPGAYVGPGATNHRYVTDEATREANLSNINTQIAGQEKLDTENRKGFEDLTKQYYEGQLGEAREKLGSAAETNAATRSELAITQGELNAAKAARTADPIGQRIAEADRIGLKGEDRKYYLANGKLKEATDRQPTDLEAWMQAFKRDNGRAPTADEIAQRKAKTRGSPGDFKNVEEKKNQALAQAEREYKKAIGEALTPEDRQQALEDLNTAKQRAQAGYEQEIRSLGGSTDQAAPTNSSPAKPAPAAKPGTAPQSKATGKGKPVQSFNGRKVNDVVTLRNGQKVRITQMYDSGHFDYQPAK